MNEPTDKIRRSHANHDGNLFCSIASSSAPHLQINIACRRTMNAVVVNLMKRHAMNPAADPQPKTLARFGALPPPTCEVKL